MAGDSRIITIDHNDASKPDLNPSQWPTMNYGGSVRQRKAGDVSVKVYVFFLILIVLGVLFARWLYNDWCTSHYVACQQQADVLWNVLFCALLTVIGCGVYYLARRVHFATEAQRGNALRSQVERNRFGDLQYLPMLQQMTLEQVIAVTMQQYSMSTQLERDIAPHKRYSGVQTLNEGDNSSVAPVIQAAPQLETVPDESEFVLPVSEWMQWIDQRPHVILAAETGGGKSTTAKAILAPRIQAHEDVFVIDPHSSEWLGLIGVGGGENWAKVQEAMEVVAYEYHQRMQERDRYLKETGQELPHNYFKRLTVLMDEGNNAKFFFEKVVKAKRGSVSPWVEFTQVLGSGARKVSISVVLLLQSANVDDLGISGEMRKNFTRIGLDNETCKYLISKDTDGKRKEDLLQRLVGRSYPAATVVQGRAYLLDRTGLDRYVRPTNAAACAWQGWDYEADKPAHQQTEQAPAQLPRNNDTRDKLARLLFSKGNSFRTVASALRQNGFAVDNNRLSELYQEVKG